MRTILGIDEAGRGAVLGPLVLAGVLFKDSDEIFDILNSAGIADSKLVTPHKRTELARLIRKMRYGMRVQKIQPSRINKNSINDLEIRSSARIIDALTPHVVYLDVPASGAGIENYCNQIRAYTRHVCKLKGGNKLDRTNSAVAAASIVAKEAREAAVRKLWKRYGSFGSGYPHDPNTKAWLAHWKKSNKPWPAIVRTKWSTIKILA